MLHERIKAATTQEHMSAEKHSYGREIMDRSLTSTQYSELLVANYSYIAAWERQWDELGKTFGLDLNLDSRRKTTLLEEDLRKQGIDPSHVSVTELDVPGTRAQFLGRMYVIEGSTLGGAVIEKQLKLNPNLNDSGFAFYGGYGQDLIPYWKAFLAVLNTIEDTVEQDEAIAWAKASFTDMEQCFISARFGSVNS
ncbi:MAG: biliverdin-producing heme oxygenase [Bacteroidia bacterium]|nr:biliverdin-producing heme oxygenase [Bacteroidia bacterium]